MFQTVASRKETNMRKNTYYQTNDGWFTYYVNIKTGKKKFTLDEGDVLVYRKHDDFYPGKEVR